MWKALSGNFGWYKAIIAVITSVAFVTACGIGSGPTQTPIRQEPTPSLVPGEATAIVQTWLGSRPTDDTNCLAQLNFGGLGGGPVWTEAYDGEGSWQVSVDSKFWGTLVWRVFDRSHSIKAEPTLSNTEGKLRFPC